MIRDFINACWFAFKWGFLAALVAGVAVGLFYYSRLNDAIRQRVEAKFAAGYPNLHVVVRSARLIDGQGIEVRGLSISDPRLTGPPAELAYFDELLLCCTTNLADLIEHDPKFTRIILRRPRLQATRLADGSLSVSKLLPLPTNLGGGQAEMLIEGGQMALFDPQRNPPTTYNIHDINLRVQPVASAALADPKQVAPALLEIVGSLAADHIQQIEVSGRFDRATGACDFQGKVDGIDVSPDLLAPIPPEYAEQLKPISPLRGQASLLYRVCRDPSQVRPWTFDVTGQLVSGRIEDARMPQALANVQAKFHADNAGIQISEMTARNGPTVVRVDARIGGYQSDSTREIDVAAEHLLVGPHWENMLPPRYLDQWRKFLPFGEVNIKQGRLRFDGQRWQMEGAVECLNVSFTYYRFPYRLEQGAGTLQMFFDPQVGQNRLKANMTAFAGSRPVKIDGDFLNPGPEFTGWVTMSGSSLPFDQNLFSAIAATQKRCSEIIQTLHPSGAFNFSVRCNRDDPRSPAMQQHLVVDLDHCSMRYEKFAYPLYNVVGKLEMLDGQWTFPHLEGVNHTSRIVCDGSITQAPEGRVFSLNFRGRDIAIEEELRDALPPRMQQLWNELRPKGSFNLVGANISFTSAANKFQLTTTVEPVADTVSINPTFFPYRVEKIQGQITFTDALAKFDYLSGEHDRTKISAGGFCEHSPDGQWHLHMERFNADKVRFDADRDLITALPLPLRKAADQLKPTGIVNLHGMVDFSGSSPPLVLDGRPAAVPGQCRVRTDWRDLQVDIEDGTLHAGLDQKDIHGGAAFSGSYDPQREEGQRLMTRGELNVDSLTWNNFQFTGITGPIWIDDRQVVFGASADDPNANRPPRRLKANCYGGGLEANGFVRLDATPWFNVKAAIDNVDVNRFCGESVPGKQKLKGRVSAAVDLKGTAAGLHTLQGVGDAHLRSADIGSLPVMVALLKVLNLKRPDTNAFTNCDIKRFRIDGEHVLLENIEFSGDAISLVGQGEVKLNTEINLRLQPILGRSDIQLPAWKSLMGGASEQLMQIQVTGTLAEPKSKQEALPTIKQAFQSIQAGMEPERSMVPQSMRPPAADAAVR